MPPATPTRPTPPIVNCCERISELADNAALAEMLQKTTAAEQAAIQFQERRASRGNLRSDQHRGSHRSRSPTAALNRRRVHLAAGSTRTSIACVRIEGALYGLEVATGKLLWRRYVGPGTAWPQSCRKRRISSPTPSTTSCFDSMRKRAGCYGGKQSASRSPRRSLSALAHWLPPNPAGCMLIDMKSGHRAGYVQFAQPLRVAPTVQSGERAPVSVSATIRRCTPLKRSTYPALACSTWATPRAASRSRPRRSWIKSRSSKTTARHEPPATSVHRRKRRHCRASRRAPTDRPAIRRRRLVAGRRLIVVTDRGQIDVYDIGGEGEEALTPVATRVATGTSPLVRYISLAGRNIWIGDTQLTKFSILPTGNRLPVEAIENNFTGSTFDHPLAALRRHAGARPPREGQGGRGRRRDRHCARQHAVGNRSRDSAGRCAGRR